MVLLSVALNMPLSIDICWAWKTQQWPLDSKRSVFIPILKKGNAKECSAQVYQSHTLAKKCSKFSKPGFNNMWTENFHMFKLDLEKAEEPEIKLPTSAGSSKKAREFQKNIYFCFIDYAKDCLHGSQQTVENSSRDGNTREYLTPEKHVCRTRNNS